MRWKITIEGMDEFGGRENVEMVVEKEFSGLSKGEIGLSISDSKASWRAYSSLWSNSNVRPMS